jgi:electron transfer flavoprotein alpha subunit
MSVLVLADHDGAALKPATLNTVAAALRLGGPVAVLIAGHGCGAAAEAAAVLEGPARVLVADDPRYAHGRPEPLATLIAGLAGDATHVLAPANALGKSVMPRVAALLDVAQISDIVEVVSADEFVRPIYAGSALATVRSTDRVKVVTVRPTAFDPVAAAGGAATVETVPPADDFSASAWLREDLTRSDRPELTTARVVVAGGRGLQNAENFHLLEKMADALGGAIGASRAAVDAGWVPNDYQVGQTGKVVAPELYIAVGISGAIQHLAGMKDAKVIVAINKDEEAPIFQVADYGLVADLFQAVPELTAEFGK